VRGRRLTIYAIIRNGQSEVLDFLDRLREQDPAAYGHWQERLQRVADVFPIVPETRLRKLQGKRFEDLWEIKRGPHRLYGFVAPGGLYLCRYGFKTRQKPERALLQSVANCLKEWREQNA